MPAPVTLAAIDAGSNAIRMAIARADSAAEIHILETERFAVRLGHRAFTEHRFDRGTLSRAADAFRSFRRTMDRYGVAGYRGVATSAAREARNRRELLRRIRREAGLRLEVIDSAEEARLVRAAVLGALDGKVSPELVIDLGGGSLELNQLRGQTVKRTVALPLGTVRVMETFGLRGAFSETQLETVRHHVETMLATAWSKPPRMGSGAVVGCGGNAEQLARTFPGPRLIGLPTLNLRLLQERLWELLRLDVAGRMKRYGVRRDRAEVMGIAAVIFSTLGRWMGLRSIVVPGVGVREGTLRELAAEHFLGRTKRARNEGEEILFEQARQLAAKFHADLARAEQVRFLAAQLFDRLHGLHRLPQGSRQALELGALLHEVGAAVNPRGFHKHGEYIVRNAALAGSDPLLRNLAACLVRYQGKALPRLRHRCYASLPAPLRRQVKPLAALLRIAASLDADGNQAVRRIEAIRHGRQVRLAVVGDRRIEKLQRGARRSAELFESEFGARISFRWKAEPAARKRRGGTAAVHRMAAERYETSAA